MLTDTVLTEPVHTETVLKEPVLKEPVQTITSIDMFTPNQTCRELLVDEPELLDMINDGRLPAYNICGQIRFKVIDVVNLFCLRAVA